MPNYVLQRTPGTFYVLTYHRGPAPLNTALGSMTNRWFSLAFLGVAPTAQAHHEAVLFPSVGQLVAFAAIALLAWRLRAHLLSAASAVLAASAVALSVWWRTHAHGRNLHRGASPPPSRRPRRHGT